MSASTKGQVRQGQGVPRTVEELFELFLSTLPSGQQANIRESMARGESLTRAAFDFAIAHSAVAGTGGEAGAKPVGHVDMRGPSGGGDRIQWTGWALPHGAALYAHALAAASTASQPLTENDVFTLVAHAQRLRTVQASDTAAYLFEVAERIALGCGASHVAERVRQIAAVDRACSP